MQNGEVRPPKIILPYQYTCPGEACQEIILYLRPETNGIQVESTLLKVLRAPERSDKIKLVYLANIPGSFIVQKRIVEHHYASRLHFAASGRYAFTETMKSQFERFFGVKFESSTILGAFEALQVLKLTPEELFNLWVPVYDILEINGQLIKRTEGGNFIVNYDIPAILHKNNNSTDVAVMAFRMDLSYQEFKPILDDMREALIREAILDPYKPESRVFHFSKGPFEQLLDGLGYLYIDDEKTVKLEDLSFGAFLLEHGIPKTQIQDSLKKPIMQFKIPGGNILEANIYTFTIFDSYQTAYEKLISKIN